MSSCPFPWASSDTPLTLQCAWAEIHTDRNLAQIDWYFAGLVFELSHCWVTGVAKFVHREQKKNYFW